MLVAWLGCLVQPGELPELQDALRDALGLTCPVAILGCAETLPTPGSEMETGGRVDLFFRVHRKDVARVAIKKLGIEGMRWGMDMDEELYSGGARDAVLAARSL